MSDKINRTKILQAYLDNQVEYLKTIYGEENYPNQYRNFIKEIVIQNLKRPVLDVIVHESYGNAELKQMDLLTFTNENSDKIITPSGSLYLSVKEKISFLKQFIEELLTQRKKVKKKMLDAEAKGNKDLAILYKNEQATIKINANSLIGAMGNPYNCFYDKAGFNAVTSISRQSIMTAYAHTERFLEGNFYFPNNEVILNHLTILKKYKPDSERISNVVKKFNLYIPEPEDVLDFIIENKINYTEKGDMTLVHRFLTNCSTDELCWFYYYGNLKNIFQTGKVQKNDFICGNNHNYFMNFIRNLFDLDDLQFEYGDLKAEQLYTLDEDLLIMMGNIYGEMLDGLTIFDLPTSDTQLAKKMFIIGSTIQSKLNSIWEIFDLFIDTQLNIPAVTDSKNLIRRCVIVSDTDSVLFSTKNWIAWYTNELSMSSDAYRINALIIYLLTKTMTYALRTSTKAFGALNKDVDSVRMKNEFLYYLYLNTILKKHYAGIIAIQEGRILPKAKKDIKGGNLRGSSLPKITLKYTENFIFDLFDEIKTNKTLKAKDVILRVIAREQEIIQSLKNGEITFLENEPIREKEAYVNPESSIYWYFEMWQEIFAPKYGDITIPSKAILMPVLNNAIRSEEYLNYLKTIDENIYEKLLNFLNTNPKKNITRVIINPILKDIPPELKPIVHTNPIVYSNLSPIYLVMRSLGLAIGNEKNKFTFTDLYL